MSAGRVIAGASRIRKLKSALEVTDQAAKRLGQLISQRTDNPPLGIRLGVKKRGCSGLAYTLNYATDKKATDEVVDANGIKVFIDPQALMSVVGTKMDFVEDPLKSEFVFINPNATGTCGCGESFHV
eukprot:TRINITY_DN11518_c0_g1_i1.p1 TRINITY_DN11518_c0_g1~~TRINITY_DN11518_c0_g1_i1.p1  ORF type:complete len:127 (+),score=34.01 TRINITY_DN11518_c0_g1_i1:95-475(+)